MFPSKCSYLQYFHGYILLYNKQQTNHFAWKKKDLRKIAWKYYR